MISNIIRNFNRKEEEVNVGPYLEFKSSTPMTITPNYTNTGITLQYSLDTITWTNIAAKVATPSANTIYFRGRATGTKSLFTNTTPSNAWLFTGATNLEVYGDITMLLQDTLGGMVSDVALGNYAFAYMFYNCAALLKASELPATTLGSSCYSYMFSNCTSLTVAPELPATTLATSCYQNMFYGCTSLTTPPELPATTLANYCYSVMFYGCTSLTIAPTLPATTLAPNCYSSMFYGCTSLTTAPTLPATTLASSCYGSMFYNCTSLTTAPTLPATTLATSCYGGMFYRCTKIKLSTTKTGNYQTAYRVPTVGTGMTATNALLNMFTGTGGTFVGSPTINTTYYTENQVI